jgi:hypothetical protein
LTGAKRWDFPLHVGSHAAGVLSTAGGVVFAASQDGYLIALDARTGKELWHYQTGTQILSSPISFSVLGKQWLQFNQFVSSRSPCHKIPLIKGTGIRECEGLSCLEPRQICRSPKAIPAFWVWGLADTGTPCQHNQQPSTDNELGQKGTYVEETDSLAATLWSSSPGQFSHRAGVWSSRSFSFQPRHSAHDGKADDWGDGPEYTPSAWSTFNTGGRGTKTDLKRREHSRWAKRLNCLYFLYESYDDFWDFNKTDLQ